MSLSNSTVAFNTITGPALSSLSAFQGDTYGGGIFVVGNGAISFSTIASNRLITSTGSAPGASGLALGAGIYMTNALPSERLQLLGSIFSGNVPGNFLVQPQSVLEDLGGNISSDETLLLDGDSSRHAENPVLNTMRWFNNLAFFPLQEHSPGIDRLRNLESAAENDQLGYPRLLPDSGAVEWQGDVPNLLLRLIDDAPEIELSVSDPTYTLQLEESVDLKEWRRAPLGDFSPKRELRSQKQQFFRLRSGR
jgi:hypothetical protein